MVAQVVIAALDAGGRLTGIGRARRVARALVENGAVVDWQEIEVKWDEGHGLEPEGNHHANIAKFLIAQKATQLVAAGAGPDMRRMIERMGVRLLFASGTARASVEALVRFDGPSLSTVA